MMLVKTRTPEQVLEAIPQVDNQLAVQQIAKSDPGFFGSLYDSAMSILMPAAGAVGGALMGEFAGPSGAAFGAQLGSYVGQNSLGYLGVNTATTDNDTPYTGNPGNPNGRLMLTNF